MKLSLVLIIYRSKSTIAKETASFCENLLESQKITVKRFSSNFDNKTLQTNLEINDYLPDLVVVLGGIPSSTTTAVPVRTDCATLFSDSSPPF